MQAGSLRHRVDIQALVETKDSYGQMKQSWSTVVANVAAEVKPLQGREVLNAGQIKSELTHQVRMRWIDSLQPGKRTKTTERIVFNGRNLDIVQVANVVERNRELLIHCQELVSP